MWLEAEFPAVARCLTRIRYRGEHGAVAACPNGARHRRGDKTPSLLLMRAANGGLVFHCKTGCSKPDVLAAMGLRWRDVCCDRPREGRAMSVQLVKTYPYLTPEGKAAFEVCRYVPKSVGFHPRRKIPGSPAGDEWVYSIVGGPVARFERQGEFRWNRPPGWREGDPCPAGAFMTAPAEFWPYHADLLAAEPDRVCFWCEGEKDADAARQLGFLATTTQGGAGGRHWRKPWGSLFKGRLVIIVPDHDQAGYDYCRWVAGCLVVAGASGVVVLNLPDQPEKGDLSDWLWRKFPRPEDRTGHESPAARAVRGLVAKAACFSRRKMNEMFPPRKAAKTPELAYRGDDAD